MEILIPILVFGVLVGIAIIVGQFRLRREKRRSEELAAIAQQAGWVFKGGHDSSFHDIRSKFDWFRRGHSRFAHNQMQGVLRFATGTGDTIEASFETGDYHYKSTRSGKHRYTTTYRFSYLLINFPPEGSELTPLMKKHLQDAQAADLHICDGVFCFADGRKRWKPPEFVDRVRREQQFLDQWLGKTIGRYDPREFQVRCRT